MNDHHRQEEIIENLEITGQELEARIRILETPPDTQDKLIGRTICHDAYGIPVMNNDPSIPASIQASIFADNYAQGIGPPKPATPEEEKIDDEIELEEKK